MTIRGSIILAYLKKEFKQMFRDRKMAGILFGSPLIMLLIFSQAVNTDVKYVKMAIFDEDKTMESRQLIENFISSKHFLYFANLNSEKEMTPLMESGKIEVYLHIERNFSEKIKNNRVAVIQLLVDGTDSSRAAVIVAQLNAITSTFSSAYFKNQIQSSVMSLNFQGIRMKKAVEMKERFQFNPDLSSQNYFMPGIIGLLLALITTMLTAMAIVKERETGTIEQIIVSPLEPTEIIIGKIVPFLIVSFFDSIIITLLLIFLFRVPFQGNIFLLLLCCLIYVFSTTSIGLFISTVSRTQQQALLSVFLFFLPAIMLSGFVFPIYSMPIEMQLITYLNPVRYFMTIVRGIFLKGVGIDILWPEILCLLILGIALFYFSSQRFKRRMD